MSTTEEGTQRLEGTEADSTHLSKGWESGPVCLVVKVEDVTLSEADQSRRTKLARLSLREP